MPNKITVVSPDEYRQDDPPYVLGSVLPESADEYGRFEDLARRLVHTPKPRQAETKKP